MVLKEVLRCIYEKGYIKPDEISRELSIPRGLVEYAIQKLKDTEYLIPVPPLPQGVSCRFCPLNLTCNIKTTGIIKSYTLTEKGKKLLTAPNEKRSTINAMPKKRIHQVVVGVKPDKCVQ